MGTREVETAAGANAEDRARRMLIVIVEKFIVRIFLILLEAKRGMRMNIIWLLVDMDHTISYRTDSGCRLPIVPRVKSGK